MGDCWGKGIVRKKGNEGNKGFNGEFDYMDYRSSYHEA